MRYLKWTVKIFFTLLVIVIVWEGFFVLPDPSRLPNPLWQVSTHRKMVGERLWVKQRLLDAGEDIRVTYPPIEQVLKEAATLPGVGWSGMRDPQVATTLACAWVGRGQFKELIDCRPAFLAPSGTTVDWQVEVTPGMVLKAGITALSMPGVLRQDPVEFRISFLDAKSRKTIIYDNAVTAMDPESYPRSWWHTNFGKYLTIEKIADRQYWVEVAVEFSQELSGTGILRFETIGSSPHVFPFWAEPRLISSATPISHDLPDVVYFQIDAVQARLLEDSVLMKKVTPNISRLKESGVYFRNAITNGTWTRPSMYSMFASRPHGELGTPIVGYSIASVERDVFYRTVTKNLITEMKKAGYTTVMMGNNAFLHSATSLGMDVGFDRVWDVERDYYDTVDITEMAIRYMLAHPREALFLFVNYNAPHYSYKPPPRYSRKVFGSDYGDWRFLANQYLGEVRYVDEYLGRVVRALEMLGRRENTLIVASADHGELTRRHPVIKKCAAKVSSGTKMVYQHGRSFFDDELRVPLIFSWVGKLPEHTVITEQVQLMDVAPTMLDLVKGGYPEEFQGKTLVPLIRGEGGGSPVVFSESRNGISMRVENHWKYARRFPGFEAVWVQTAEGLRVRDLPEELYDLTVDPLEVRNLAEEGHPRLDEFRKMFDENVPGPVWVYRIVLPDSGMVSGEAILKELPLITGSIGDVTFSLDGKVLQFSGSQKGRGEIYWIPKRGSDGGLAATPVVHGAPVRWGPFALAGSGDVFREWAGLIPSSVVSDHSAVWFQKNALEMWVAAGSGREPIVGGVREILKDWGYIQ